MDETLLKTFQQAIFSHFPQFRTCSVRFFKEGWGNRLFLVDGTILFRFPADTAGEQSLLLETRLLPIIAPELPLPVPNYQYIAQASEAYAFAFAGYPLIPGSSYGQVPDELGKEQWWRAPVGEFLSALHRIPIHSVEDIGLPAFKTAQVWRDALAQKHPLYEQHVFPLLSISQQAAVRSYLHQSIRDERMVSFAPVIIHQDFGFHNFLVDREKQQVTGVVDFANCSIGDPALDVPQEVISYYHGDIDPGWNFRCEYYGRTAALEDLLAICTSGHPIPNAEQIRRDKLAAIARIWPA